MQKQLNLSLNMWYMKYLEEKQKRKTRLLPDDLGPVYERKHVSKLSVQYKALNPSYQVSIRQSGLTQRSCNVFCSQGSPFIDAIMKHLTKRCSHVKLFIMISYELTKPS
jgi:hypothetical protein